MRTRITLWSLALVLCIGELDASVVYNLRDGRYFPDMPTADNQTVDANFTSTSSDALPVSYSSAPGNPAANTFDAVASVNTGPFTLGTQNSVTIGTPTTTFQSLGILSIVESGITDSTVTITGGVGTGYLLPTFHVTGVMSDASSNANVGDLICAGNNTCILSSVFATVTSGVHNEDGFFTPSIDSNTSFTFGTPFTFFFFFGSTVGGSNGNTGGPVSADLTLQFVGFQVVDANGQSIPGAQINSPFLGALVTPEPGTGGMALAVIAILGLLAARKNKVGTRSRRQTRVSIGLISS